MGLQGESWINCRHHKLNTQKFTLPLVDQIMERETFFIKSWFLVDDKIFTSFGFCFADDGQVKYPWW